jgi:hypothetical protein
VNETHQLETPATPAAPTFPWPPTADESAFSAFVRTWQGATFQPRRFFRALPDELSTGSALLYYIVLGVLVAGAELFWVTIRPPALAYDSILSSVGGGAALDPLVEFLLSPLLLLVSIVISAGVTHALLRLFGGARLGFTQTLRVFAFAYSPMIFATVPVIGTIVGFIWMIVVAIAGVREGHQTTMGRAAAAVLVPVVVALFLLGVVLLVTAAGSLLEIPV